MSLLRFKLVFFAPKDSTRGILDHLFRKFPNELGKIGNYEQCAFIMRGTGQFMPNQSAHPTTGTGGQLEFVEEDRVELLVNDKGGHEEIKRAIKELKNVHPSIIEPVHILPTRFSLTPYLPSIVIFNLKVLRLMRRWSSIAHPNPRARKSDSAHTEPYGLQAMSTYFYLCSIVLLVQIKELRNWDYKVLLGFLGSLSTAAACADAADGHVHEHSRRAIPSSPLTLPTRALEWGDVNFIHTTDSHGWLLGHQKTSFPEPNYSGDFGDFASFVTHMKEIAIQRDVDLLLVDSGDLHDGTGLTDGFPAGGVDAHDANQFIKQLPYDIMAIGNHELYIYANALDMHQNFAPSLNGRYLSSNVNITLLDNKGDVVTVPVGNRFAKFKTRKGKKVTAFGVLYDFTGNDHNTTVQKVENMVKEAWFLDAIKEEPDFFLLVGHMPVARDNWPAVFNTIRAVHPTTPIFIFGGHTHIRDCLQMDGRSMSLESGRYMETIGWMSAKLDKKGSKGNLTISRRYLDPNRVTFEFHTKKNGFNFDTLKGTLITKGLNALAKKFDLSFLFGTAPHDYTLSRSPYPSNDSLLTLFIQQAVPIALAINNTRANIPNIVLANSGGQRFDIYAGAFTKNDQLTASPFDDAFQFIPGVPFSVANSVLPTLNKAGANQRRAIFEQRNSEAYARGEVETIYRKWLEEMDRRNDGMARRAAKNLTLGYVTTDSCPGVGDDTLHAPLPFFSSPDFVASNAPIVPSPAVPTADSPVDLIFLDFIAPQVIPLLNTLQTAKVYSTADVQIYSPLSTNEVLGVFAQTAWN